MAFDDRDLTSHEKDQLVFSDTRFDPSGTKDFKQIARADYLDQISGRVEAEQEKKLSEFTAGMAHANAEMTKQHEERMLRLNGIDVSEISVRKTATFFRDNIDKLASANGWSDEHRDRIEQDLDLLENGSSIQQREAFDRISEYDPKFSEQYVIIADNYDNNAGYNPESDYSFGSANETPKAPSGFGAYQVQ